MLGHGDPVDRRAKLSGESAHWIEPEFLSLYVSVVHCIAATRHPAELSEVCKVKWIA